MTSSLAVDLALRLLRDKGVASNSAEMKGETRGCSSGQCVMARACNVEVVGPVGPSKRYIMRSCMICTVRNQDVQGQASSVFYKASRLALGLPGTVSLEMRRSEREAEHTSI